MKVTIAAKRLGKERRHGNLVFYEFSYSSCPFIMSASKLTLNRSDDSPFIYFENSKHFKRVKIDTRLNTYNDFIEGKTLLFFNIEEEYIFKVRDIFIAESITSYLKSIVDLKERLITDV